MRAMLVDGPRSRHPYGRQRFPSDLPRVDADRRFFAGYRPVSATTRGRAGLPLLVAEGCRRRARRGSSRLAPVRCGRTASAARALGSRRPCAHAGDSLPSCDRTAAGPAWSTRRTGAGLARATATGPAASGSRSQAPRPTCSAGFQLAVLVTAARLHAKQASTRSARAPTRPAGGCGGRSATAATRARTRRRCRPARRHLRRRPAPAGARGLRPGPLRWRGSRPRAS